MYHYGQEQKAQIEIRDLVYLGDGFTWRVDGFTWRIARRDGFTRRISRRDCLIWRVSRRDGFIWRVSRRDAPYLPCMSEGWLYLAYTSLGRLDLTCLYRLTEFVSFALYL